MYSANFQAAIKVVLANEGGYSDTPGDHGGATDFGITEAVARAHGYQGDMQALPLPLAIAIYYASYWDAHFDAFPSALATKVFDTAVNAGVHRAHVLLQQALNTQGNHLDTDGVLGPATASAVLAADPSALLTAYREAQRQFYLDIIARDPSQAKFEHAWLRRAAE